MKLCLLMITALGALALVAGCGDPGQDRGAEPHPADPGGHAATADAPRPAAAPASEAPAVTKAPMAFDEKPAVGTRATCPVMKGEFVVSETTDHSEYAGKHYVFCCPGCKPRFDADPKKFVDE